jgi:hypothetical protein
MCHRASVLRQMPKQRERQKTPKYVEKKRNWQRHVKYKLPQPTRPCPQFCEVYGCFRSATQLDHDHATGLFRGWLCRIHNMGLGALGDNIAGLEYALDYLRGNIPC